MLSRISPELTEGKSGKLRIQPELNLDYPDSDIAEVSFSESDGYSITTTFFGLYGVSSPLPGFYTEELLDDEWDELQGRKDLFDVIHNQVYPLLYQAWLKYKFAHNTVELRRENYWEIIFDFAGLGDTYRQDKASQAHLCRYAGLFSQRNKSLLGLKTLLSDYLNNIPIDILPCIERKVSIPRHQRSLLGKQSARLGEDACIGKQVSDRNGKFLLQLGPLDAERFRQFSDVEAIISEIRQLVHRYLVQPLEFGVVLLLEPGAISPACLGVKASSSLGGNCWLIDRPNQETQAIEIFDEKN